MTIRTRSVLEQSVSQKNEWITEKMPSIQNKKINYDNGTQMKTMST